MKKIAQARRVLIVFRCRSKTQRHRVSRHRPVTDKFLQQARLGKHKAPAGGSGLEKIVGRSSQYCSAPGWDRQQEHQQATRKPPAGFCTAVRRDLHRREKQPKAALRPPERSIRRALGYRGISQASRAVFGNSTGEQHGKHKPSDRPLQRTS